MLNAGFPETNLKATHMLQESPELLAISRRWYNAVVTRKEAELQNYLSQASELRFVGSAKGEHWFGAAVREGIGRHFNEVPEVTKKEEALAEAFEFGDVGWSFFTHRFWFEGMSDPVEFRTTLIFALENGSWKIMHRHASVPSSNETTTGHGHSAIQELLDAAHSDFNLGQTEGLASIMFTDIAHSSPIAEAVGDRIWSGFVAEHFDDVRHTIEAHGGQFVKSLGDGTMSSFASARSALEAAVAIQSKMARQTQEPFVSVRIGIHTGDVVRSSDDFFGTVVNKAARITAVAEAGAIYLSDTTHAVVGTATDFAFSKPKSIILKGLAGEHQVRLLDWQGSS
ncbi:adenylate/guanylate cyclase domain-containing protein [Sulfitobacter sp. JB4-11]|uniref:adenylate/guanylate cyclase domain-containing protein n=1 Tax=Sulfitobacter rhodophyticola TaxID=3238304 RepID=UPI003D819FF2